MILNNLLYTPKITKNLVYASQFTRDTNAYFELHPSYCVIRDSTTGEVLLEGVESGGSTR